MVVAAEIVATGYMRKPDTAPSNVSSTVNGPPLENSTTI